MTMDNTDITDPQTFLDDGYVIVRNAIPRCQLDELRSHAELFLTRAEERSRGNLNIGWDTHRIPHPGLYEFVDDRTNRLYEPLLSDHLLAINRKLMRSSAVGLNSATLFKQPKHKLDHRFQWHRDGVLRPSAPLPMLGLQAEHQANACGTITWNIPLFEDHSLWVVPGSNRRPNNREEQALFDRPGMQSDSPLPGAIVCELGSGDAVAFDATMVHSGSADADMHRRTFNLNYRSFGGPVLPYGRITTWKPDLCDRLPDAMARHFVECESRIADEWLAIESVLRAIIAGDRTRFCEALARLHPGTEMQIACVVQIHRHAHALWVLSELDGGKRASDADYQAATLDHPSNRWRTEDLFSRFESADTAMLKQRFAPLDRALRTGLNGAYDEVYMPREFAVEEFVGSW